MGGDPLIAKRAAVFFDRDGVLNKAHLQDGRPYPPPNGRVVLEDGAKASLRKLAPVIPLMFVVTNQPDVSRGTRTRAEVERVHRTLASELPITAFYTCFHDDADYCSCRKPLTGLLDNAAADYRVDLSNSYLVGDRWRDIDAGAAAGVTTLLIDRGYSERVSTHAPDITVSSTAAAVEAILNAEALRSASRNASNV